MKEVNLGKDHTVTFIEYDDDTVSTAIHSAYVGVLMQTKLLHENMEAALKYVKKLKKCRRGR